MSVMKSFYNKNYYMIKKSGLYELEIISAFYHKANKSKRECIYLLFYNEKENLYAYFYLVLASPKGRIREFERKNILDKLMVLGEIYELEADKIGEALYLDFKQKIDEPKLLLNTKEAKIYSDLKGKKYLIDLCVSKKYTEMGGVYLNYAIMEIYHPITKQTMFEYIKNLPSLEFDNATREH